MKSKALKLKEHCSNLFMYILNNYSFQENNVNSSEIIDFLWNIVTDCPENDKVMSKKEDFIYKGNIDPNVFLRIFVLTRIFKHSETIFYEKLKGLMVNESSNVLIINCVEDFFKLKYTKLKNEEKKLFLLKNFKEQSQIIKSYENEENVTFDKFLIAIGVIRFCLDEIAKNYIDDIKKTETEVFSLLKNVLSGSNDFPRKYLLKCIFKFHGRSCIEELNQFEDIQWLIPSNALPKKIEIDFFSMYNKEDYRRIRKCFDLNQLDENVFNDSFLTDNQYFTLMALYSSLSYNDLETLPKKVRFIPVKYINLKQFCTVSGQINGN